MPVRPALAAGATTALVLALSLTACGSKKAGAAAPEAELSATPQAQVTAAPAADAKVIRSSMCAIRAS